MDSRVTARFYKVSKQSNQAAELEIILKALAAKGLSQREQTLDEGIILLLERLEDDGEFLAGEFCRKQTSNIPPSAGDDGLTPTQLGTGKGLGHTAAFRYHLPTRVILLQFNRQCASQARILTYLGTEAAKPLFSLEPVLRKDSLDQLQARKVKSFRVRFAAPDKLESLDDASKSAIDGAKMLAEAFQGFVIDITIGAGKSKKRHLDQNTVLGAISSLLGRGKFVRDVKARTEDGDSDWIDLLEEHLKSSSVLSFPTEDAASNYQVRKEFLAGVFHANLPYIKKMYGPRANGH
jgi:hypothetical protein